MQQSSVFQRVIAFNHLVELTTVNRWLAAFAMGSMYFVENFKVGLGFLDFFVALLAIFLVLCYVMSINDTFDVEDDKIRSKLTGKKMVVSVEISVRDALALSIVMLASGLAISFLVSNFFLLIVFIIVVLSTLYSVPPVRYKNIFPFSTLGEFVGAFLPFLAGYAVLGSVDSRALIVSAIFALITQYWRFFHETLFYDTDLKLGKATFAVVYGKRASKYLGMICLSSAVVGSMILATSGWFSLKFIILLGLCLLFSLGFWYWFIDYLPAKAAVQIKNILGPTWGIIFLSIAVALTILW